MVPRSSAGDELHDCLILPADYTQDIRVLSGGVLCTDPLALLQASKGRRAFLDRKVSYQLFWGRGSGTPSREMDCRGSGRNGSEGGRVG